MASVLRARKERRRVSSSPRPLPKRFQALPPSSSVDWLAEDVLAALTPAACKRPGVLDRLRQELVSTAADLAELNNDDLRDLGLGMAERRRLLSWALGEEEGHSDLTPTEELGVLAQEEQPRTNFKLEHRASLGGRPLQCLEKAERDMDLWFDLAADIQTPHLASQLQRFLSGHCNGTSGPHEMPSSREIRMRCIREDILEEQFDLTPDRMREVFFRLRRAAGGEIRSAKQLSEGLSQLGLASVAETHLARAIDTVTGGSCSSLDAAGLQLEEFEVIFSRLKLAQLLGKKDGGVSDVTQTDLLTVCDFDLHQQELKTLSGVEMCKFFFGHRGIMGTEDDDDGCCPVRWVHLRNCQFELLLALAVKYRLHPLGVEDVLEQRPTKVDLCGQHIFITLEHLWVAGGADGEGASPVQVRSRHVSIICSAPPRFDTVITVDQPNRCFAEDWPGELDSGRDESDAWVSTLQSRLRRLRSRLRERKAHYLAHHIIDMCADELVQVTRAYSARLRFLEQALQGPSAGPGAGTSRPVPMSQWLEEVSLVRLQLAVVARRLRSHRSMVRRLGEAPGVCGEDRLLSYLDDVADHLEEALDDSHHLTDRCDALTVAYEIAVSREQARQREEAKQSDRRVQEQQNRHAERLNDTLFVLTVFTAMFAPVQLISGVYGMNFVNAEGHPTIPELLWPNGYAYFWIFVVLYFIVVSLFATRLFQKLRFSARAANEQVQQDRAGQSGARASAAVGSSASQRHAEAADGYQPLIGDSGPPHSGFRSPLLPWQGRHKVENLIPT